MDLFQNPFYILTATPRDDRRRLMELSDERSLLLDSSEIMDARSNLTNPRKRLVAEIAWLPGIAPKRATELLSLLESSPTELLSIDNLSPIARANLLTEGLSRLKGLKAPDISSWIQAIAWSFEDIKPEVLRMIINDDRVVSGFSEVSDISVVEYEIQERRRHYRQIIKSALDNLSPKELVKAVTDTVEIATDDGEEHGPILIDDLVDSYEVEAQEFLDKEEEGIKSLVEKLREAVISEQHDSTLSPIVNLLIQVVKNWDIVAQPIQVSAKSRGLDHDASHRIAWLIRNLALEMFNDHDKIDFSQQLTNMLREVFAEVGEVAERTAGDADALEEIVEQRALHSLVFEVEELTKLIKTHIENGRLDSSLWTEINQLCQLITDWDLDPEHDVSQHAAFLVRDFAIQLFNKYDKLDHAQRLIKTLVKVFEGAGAVSDRIIDDAKDLKEIALSRRELVEQFKVFNLNGNSFDYKGQTYNINDIRHIKFHRALTTHKTNFIETGKTEKIQMSLTMSGGQKVNISEDEQGYFFNKNKSLQINRIVEFYSYLSNVTFDRRVELYESQIKKSGFFEYDKCYFYPYKKIVFRGKEFNLLSTSFLKGYGYIEIKKKDAGIFDKIKREVSLTKIPQFSTLVDTDVIFYLLDKHFSLTWSS